MPVWFVYIVRCRDGSLYTGTSTDVPARVAAHNKGRGARYTRARGPVALLLVERKRDRSAALRREAAIKALPRAQKLALIAHAWARAEAKRTARPVKTPVGGAASGRRATPRPRPPRTNQPPDSPSASRRLSRRLPSNAG